MPPQISSFSVSPNYEILFFSSEIFEVVNIIEFLEDESKRKKETFIEKVENFEVGGESSWIEMLQETVFIHSLG